MFDLTPALQIMAMGLIIASAPLSWFWLRQRRSVAPKRLAVLTLLILFLTFDLILFGAFTRLTDSGLGCPDWPGCYGFLSPLGAQLHINDAQSLQPTGPVTHVKAWIEMIHRYLATAVGVLIITLTVATWFFWRQQRKQAKPQFNNSKVLNPWWPTVTLVWVCAQGMFGALTVTMKLFPAIVTMHLLGAIGLLVLLIIQANAYANKKPEILGSGTRVFLWLAAVLLGIQIALGAWVSTNYAVLACNTFPMCQGSWWPNMDFVQGFSLWRPLGYSSAGTLLDFTALTAIHYVHRLAAYIVIAVLIVLLIQLHRINKLRQQRRVLMVLIIIQFISGLSNVVLDWPLIAALIHTGGAAALMGVLSWAICASRASLNNSQKILKA